MKRIEPAGSRSSSRSRPWRIEHAAGCAGCSLLSGVFTVDNLDYRPPRRLPHRRIRGASTGEAPPLQLHGPRGLSLYEPGLAALEMFLRRGLFMYQQIYSIDRCGRSTSIWRVSFGRASWRSSATRRRPRRWPLLDLDEYARCSRPPLGPREALSDKPEPGERHGHARSRRVWQAICCALPLAREAELRARLRGPEREALRAAA